MAFGSIMLLFNLLPSYIEEREKKIIEMMFVYRLLVCIMHVKVSKNKISLIIYET